MDYVGPADVLAPTHAPGRLEQLREQISHSHRAPVIEIPWDLDFRAEIDAGTYTLNRVRRCSTRLPLKKLALHVAENFI